MLNENRNKERKKKGEKNEGRNCRKWCENIRKAA